MLAYYLIADIASEQVEFHHWFTFWISILLIALTIFSVMACVVTVKGWFEIKTMLQRLSQLTEESESDDIQS
ncbi:MAG: hypothetical protein OSA92_02655 [Pirellulaceae bacterium]|jgi:hypothetical protein|nr:hypothetical protein [Pirellulaceae bacterium]|tara:strand:+ start:6383 stop:6598 length:216 start_codon:yes stop_codon:yes gene_type:complete